MGTLHGHAFDLGTIRLRSVKAKQMVQVYDPAGVQERLPACVLIDGMNTAEDNSLNLEIVLGLDPDSRVVIPTGGECPH